jgi:hypothetical protein
VIWTKVHLSSGDLGDFVRRGKIRSAKTGIAVLLEMRRATTFSSCSQIRFHQAWKNAYQTPPRINTARQVLIISSASTDGPGSAWRASVGVSMIIPCFLIGMELSLNFSAGRNSLKNQKCQTISTLPKAVRPRKNANQTPPKAKIPRPVLTPTIIADGSCLAFRATSKVRLVVMSRL